MSPAPVWRGPCEDARSGAAAETLRRAHLRAGIRQGSLLGWARFALGGACVATAVVLAAIHVPRTVNALNASVLVNAYITSPEQRVITSGDSLGIPADLQIEAIQLIPKRSTYSLVLPANMQLAADKYGIQALTYGVTPAWFEYLLLPAQPVGRPTPGQYILCWHCDRAFWDPRTRWLWDNKQGQSIGRVLR